MADVTKRAAKFNAKEAESAPILDVVAALDVLRDQSRALVKPGGGWVAL
jgi:hypothetical protein